MKKDAGFVLSTVAMSMILGACSYDKEEQANAKGIAGRAVQSKL